MENTHAVKDVPAKASANVSEAKPNFDAYINNEGKSHIADKKPMSKPSEDSIPVGDFWSDLKKGASKKDLPNDSKCGNNIEKSKCMSSPFHNPLNVGDSGVMGGLGAIGGMGLEKLSKIGVVSDKERAAANIRLDKTIAYMVPESDRKSVASLGHALLGGDVKGFAEALRVARVNNRDMDKVLNELNGVLKSSYAATSVTRDQRGEFVVTSTTSNTAMKFDVKEGTFGVYQAERQRDGSVAIGDELVNTVPAKQFRQLADNAVGNIQFARNFKGFALEPQVADRPATKDPFLHKAPEQKHNKFPKEKNLGEQVGDWIDGTKKSLGWDK